MNPVVVDTDVVSFLLKKVMVASRRTGRRLETADAWIAATATLYRAPLLTHNGRDYLGVPGLRVITEANQ